MALWTITVPFSCTSLLRHVPATGRRTAVSLRTRFGVRLGTDRVDNSLGCDSRKCLTSPKIFSRDVFGRTQQLGAALLSVRAGSAFSGQGVAAEESSPGGNAKFGCLILYSKPGCCLCDGLKEKLEGSEIQLEVRDITTNSEWWNLYQYEIPVLARVRGDDIEEPLPRLSPRLSATQVQKKILALMSSDA